MDNYIELLAFYLTDWQQAAIDNTRYSVLLFVIAFFSGYLLVTLLKKSVLKDLMQQLTAETKERQEIQQHCQNLTEEQQQNASKLAEIKQQVEQLSEQKSKSETLYKELEVIHQQQGKDFEAKQQQVNELKSMLEEKDQLLELLRNDLTVQKKQLESYNGDEKKTEEMALEISALNNKNNLAEQKIQQLEKALANRSEEVTPVDVVKDEVKPTIQADNKLQSKIIELEETIQQQYQQIAELSEQLQNSSESSTDKRSKTATKEEESAWFQEKIKGIFHKIKSSDGQA